MQPDLQQSQVMNHRVSFPNEALHFPATLPQYLVLFSLDTTTLSRQNSPHQLLGSRAALTTFGSCIGICPIRSRVRACRGIWPTRGAPVSLRDHDSPVRKWTCALRPLR